MIAFYNSELTRYQQARSSANAPSKLEDFISNDPTKISWSRGLKSSFNRGIDGDYHDNKIRLGIYRPFTKQHLYFDNVFIEVPATTNRYFPQPDTKNMAICVSGVSAGSDFSALMVNTVPNLHFINTSQCFPRYRYEKSTSKNSNLFRNDTDEYHRIDNIPDATVTLFQQKYNDGNISGDDIFYYVYGVLHNENYKTRFANDLKKTLPRIPYAKTADDFRAYSQAGKKLADLHINYETAAPYPLLVHEQNADQQNADQQNADYYRVKKMTYGGGARNPDKTIIRYNADISLEKIPPEAQQYIVNGKPAIEWVMDRYQIKSDKKSKIINDPNHWSDDPRYIIDLIRKVTTVSVETVKIVTELPTLDFGN